MSGVTGQGFSRSGADPGFRRGGGVVHSEGGVSYRNFRSGSKLLQGPGQINKQTKIADSRRGGGGPMTPTKNLYPRMQVVIHTKLLCFLGPLAPGMLGVGHPVCVCLVNPADVMGLPGTSPTLLTYT